VQSAARLFPKALCNSQWINFVVFPERVFVPALMQLSMVRSAQWHGEFVVDLAPKRTGLVKRR